MGPSGKRNWLNTGSYNDAAEALGLDPNAREGEIVSRKNRRECRRRDTHRILYGKEPIIPMAVNVGDGFKDCLLAVIIV